MTAVGNSYQATSGTCASLNPAGWHDWFWVSEPSNPQQGLYVYKYCTDLPTNYAAAVGDVLTIDGWIGNEHSYTDREAYRTILKGQYDFTPAPHTGALPLQITKTGTMAPLADIEAPAGFGNAAGGSVRANPQHAGTRVHIPGPLTVTNATPPAFRRISAVTGDNVYFGFEVTGGVLVNNYRTYRAWADGGAGCDWRAIVGDGGSVTFTNGIRGVWDTYSHAPCEDGGTSSNCYRIPGFVPGADAGYTYVLYPLECATDLAP